MNPFVLKGRDRDRTDLKGLSSILDVLSLRCLLDIQLEMVNRELDVRL